MPDRVAGLHNVDARVRHHCRGRHHQHFWEGLDVRDRRRGRAPRPGRRQECSPRARADPAGKKVFDKQLPNSEPKLRAVFDKLTAKFGTVLVIVDQPASVGALPLTVARDADCKVAYLPGLAMRRIADLYPGEAKTDAKDAAVIADAARTMPHTLRSLELTDKIIAHLTLLVGFDQDLAAEATRTSNRIRVLLTQFHPSLERVLGPRLDHQAVTWLLERYGSPSALRKAGRRRLVELIRPKAPRMAQRLIDDVFDALDEQTVVVPGTGTLDIVVPSLAAVHTQRRAMEAQINALLKVDDDVGGPGPGLDP